MKSKRNSKVDIEMGNLDEAKTKLCSSDINEKLDGARIITEIYSKGKIRKDNDMDAAMDAVYDAFHREEPQVATLEVVKMIKDAVTKEKELGIRTKARTSWEGLLLEEILETTDNENLFSKALDYGQENNMHFLRESYCKNPHKNISINMLDKCISNKDYCSISEFARYSPIKEVREKALETLEGDFSEFAADDTYALATIALNSENRLLRKEAVDSMLELVKKTKNQAIQNYFRVIAIEYKYANSRKAAVEALEWIANKTIWKITTFSVLSSSFPEAAKRDLKRIATDSNCYDSSISALDACRKLYNKDEFRQILKEHKLLAKKHGWSIDWAN